MADPAAPSKLTTAATPARTLVGRVAVGWLITCFLIGTFAGLLAWFFPRLLALMGADLTHVDSVGNVFPQVFMVLGTFVALLVGLTVAIIEHEQRRSLRDIFFAALGLPTLILGTIGTQATQQNMSEVSRKLTATTSELATQNGVLTRTDVSVPVPPPPAPSKGVSLQVDLLPVAHAQVTGTGNLRQNSIGLQLRQNTYFVIYAQAATREGLASAEEKLRRQSIPYSVVQGSRGDFLLVPPGDNYIQGYTDAVLAGSRARAAGVEAFISPTQR